MASDVLTNIEQEHIFQLWDKLSDERIDLYKSASILNQDYIKFLHELGIANIESSITVCFTIVDVKKWVVAKIKYGI